jgi:hypothetical protein
VVFAERQRHAVVSLDVASRRHGAVPIRELRDEVPVRRAHHDTGAAILQHLRATDVITVGVRDDHVLELVGRSAVVPCRKHKANKI